MRLHSLKGFLCVFITAAIIAAALSGCAFPRNNPDDWREKMRDRSHHTSGEDSSDTSDYEQKPDYSELLYGEELEDYEGVFGINIDGGFEDYEGIRNLMFISESELLFSLYNEEATVLYLYDIFDGSTRRLLETDRETSLSLYPDGSALLCTFGDIVRYDFYKNVLEDDNAYLFEKTDEQTAVTSFGGELVYVEDGFVYTFNTETESERVLIREPFDAEFYSLVSTAAYLYVYGYSYKENGYWSEQYIYSRKTGLGSTVDYLTGSPISTGGNLCLFEDLDYNDRLTYVRGGKTDKLHKISLKSNYEQPVWAGEDCFVTRQTGPESIIRVYDTGRKECVSEFLIKGDDSPMFGYASLSQDKRLVAVPVYRDSGEELYGSFSVCLIITDGKTPSEGKYTYDGSVDYQELTEQGKRAYDLGQEYGVIVNIYEDAIKSYPTYEPETLTNNYLVESALDSLENVLEKFPKGFFDELCSGKIWQIEFNITGTLVGKREDRVVDAAGFYYTDYNNRYVIVADGNYSDTLELTFAHEIMHAMDEYIDMRFSFIDNNGYSDWYDYLPRGFEYNDSYFDGNGNMYSDMRYVYNGYYTSNVYFLSSYQKTYDYEDRAVMFQYLFVSGEDFLYKYADDDLDFIIKNKKVYDKAVYMCSVIRKCFKTVKVTEQAQWERVLGINSPVSSAPVGLCA